MCTETLINTTMEITIPDAQAPLRPTQPEFGRLGQVSSFGNVAVTLIDIRGGGPPTCSVLLVQEGSSAVSLLHPIGTPWPCWDLCEVKNRPAEGS